MKRQARVPVVVLAVLLCAHGLRARAQSPAPLSDNEFWRLVTELSETGGAFPQQLMSNEDSAQFVMPALEKSVPAGGAYIGVGEEQNFTYLATLQPALAFVVDIRRDNLLELLFYKAVFELSPSRADFVFHLFSRQKPGDFPAGAALEQMFAVCDAALSTEESFEASVTAVLDHLMLDRHMPLSDADRAGIRRIMSAFRNAGPARLKGYGDLSNPTYTQVMMAADLDGRQHSVLASDERYAGVRTMELENRIVPVVGDFAGEKALAGIARVIGERGLVVNAFYVSNVERYLFEQGAHGRQFYANVAALPRTDASVFIRSVITDITVRLAIPMPDNPARWRTFLFPIRDTLTGLADDRIQTYRDLFAVTR